MQRRVDISHSVWGLLWSMHVQCANLITSFHSNIKDPVIDGCTKIVSCLRGLVYDVLSKGSKKKNHLWRWGRTERAHLGDPRRSLSLYDSVCRLKSRRVGAELGDSNWEQFSEKRNFFMFLSLLCLFLHTSRFLSATILLNRAQVLDNKEAILHIAY